MPAETQPRPVKKENRAAEREPAALLKLATEFGGKKPAR